MGSSEASEDAQKNVALWTKANAEYTDENARTNWALDEIDWGIWGIPESQLNVLGDVGGLDVVELGCGTAYFSAWLAKAGAKPIGVDVTPAQLASGKPVSAASASTSGNSIPVSRIIRRAVSSCAGVTSTPTGRAPRFASHAEK